MDPKQALQIIDHGLSLAVANREMHIQFQQALSVLTLVVNASTPADEGAPEPQPGEEPAGE